MKLRMLKELRKRTLSTEITILTMLTTVCTLLLLGLAVILFFFIYFFENARKDMEQVLVNTNQQFQNKVQFLEERAIIMRHNAMLQDFFERNHYDKEEVEAQLSFSMDLFSDGNMILQQQPFIYCIYLFNNKDEYVSEHYYPMTVSETKQKEQNYRNLQAEFKQSGKQYCSVVNGEDIDICFRIFNDMMKEIGICIVGIQKEAVEMILDGVQIYDHSTWVILSQNQEILMSYGDNDVVESLCLEERLEFGNATINNTDILYSSDKGGFGIEVITAVGLNNVYTILKPIMLILIVAFFLALILAAMIAFAVSYRFTRPLNKLTESLRAFGQEDFSVRMDDYPIQEFHEIGVVFNEMAEKIQYLITQVYERQILATQSQVKFLQSQINPHFQFNILAMLSIKAKSAGNEELYQNLLAFSRLIQGKIFRRKNIKILVEEEMELVEFYLFLQKSRFQDKITYEISYGSENVKKDLIPRLLIEPLVENAVSHGIEPKNGKGRIWVGIYEEKEMLHIVVEDDGVGFDADMQQEYSKKEWNEEAGHTHTGLENTQRLLRVLYEGQYRMTIAGEKGKGTRVEIDIPIERGEENVEGNSSR